MAYEVKLIINGKKESFKRTEAPFLIDQTRALTLQQHQIKTFGKDNGPSDKDLMDNAKDIGKFASDFFKNQFSVDDFVNGAQSDAIKVNNEIISECLGGDDSDGDGEAKK